MYKVMTPGPTQVRENVRTARSLICTNPDIDESFVEFYHDTCKLISSLLYTDNETLILSGEGILGLEAACATLTETGDKVLVIDNGIYGRGFADFVTMYGGQPALYTVDYSNTIDVNALDAYLKENHDFKYASVVHCDTPSGMKNDVSKICPLLKKYGILTLVDSVSAMFGEEMRVDDYQIDILCGGSQKAVSAPPGLTFVTISEDAKKAFHSRKTPVAGFYTNLMTFDSYYKDKWFPYTMPISDIYGLRTAIDNIEADTNHLYRHKTIAAAVRKALVKAGLSLYLEEGFASSVTVFNVPEGLTDKEILDTMKEQYHVLIAGCFDILAGKVIRIGHMGNNANVEDVADTLDALTKTLESLGFDCKSNMKDVFMQELENL